MYCTKCGSAMQRTTKFCTKCGTPAVTLGRARAKKSKAWGIALTVTVTVIVFAIVASGGLAVWLLARDSEVAHAASFWPESPPSNIALHSTVWSFNRAFADGELTGSILSVSPSGRHFLVVYSDWMVNILERRLLNSGGRQLDRIALYEYDRGQVLEVNRIYLDFHGDIPFHDAILNAGREGVDWSECERRIALSVGFPELRIPLNLAQAHIDVFVVDFETAEYINLSAFNHRPEENVSDYRAKWYDSESITFVRSVWGDSVTNCLMHVNVATGEVTRLANLGTEWGEMSFVYGYAIRGGNVYFIREAMGAGLFQDEHTFINSSGLFYAPLDGGTHFPAPLLTYEDMMEHDWGGNERLTMDRITGMEVSPCGRWILLSQSHWPTRFLRLDLPVVAESEAAWTLCPERGIYRIENFFSRTFALPWIPFHYVALFDLERGIRVDPFQQGHLRPDVVIALTATFAPDGRSIVAGVFGDGGPWTVEHFDMLTFYQIRIDDGSFDAVKIFEADRRVHDDFELNISRGLSMSWLGNNALWLSQPMGGHNINFIAIPSAFERFVD